MMIFFPAKTETAQAHLLGGTRPPAIRQHSGRSAVKAKDATLEKLLTCLGQHGVALAPGRIIHAG
jgi:hypothetical protein